MATYEHNALQQYKDQNGNMHIVYPVTKAKNVDGLYESPALTGVPTAPTAASGTNTTQIATTKFVQTELSEIKKELSDGMTDVAAAITEKGVETATNATLALAAANIRKIKTGGGELHGATIAVTTAEETLVGMTVTLSKENVTVQNKTFDENGTCSFTDIQVGGDYTISSGDGEINVSEPISITGDNIVNKTILHLELLLCPDGSVAMPLNDVATWLRTNSTGETSSKGYTTLAQVIADTTTLNNLMANKSAMQYLARSTGFADEGCASETFMRYLGKSTYLDSTVLNSDLWLIKIYDSNYMTEIIKGLLPTMTSNTCDVGTIALSCNSYIVQGSNYLSSSEGYILTTDAGRQWYPSDATNYITFVFTNRVNVLGFSWSGTCAHAGNGSEGTVPINIYGRNSFGESWNFITTADSIKHTFNNKQGIGFLKKETYLQYKLESECPSGYSYRNVFSKLQIYGKYM